MLQTNLFNTTTFRLALIYLALFSASAIASLGYVYWNTAGFLARQTDDAVQAEIEYLAEQYAQGGQAQLVHLVIQRSRDPREALYLIVDERGSVLGGNLDRRPSVKPDQNGWLDFEFHRRTLEGAELHTARARAVDLIDGSYLIVGRDVQALRGIEYLITSSLVWALVFTIVLGLLGGIIVSRNMLARVDEINQTSRNIMRGDFAQRISVTGSGDELDQLAENLNAMLDQIEKLMTGMREVTDNIAHDLRSPLNRLRTRLEMAMAGNMSPATLRQELERSINDADQLLGTFNALLAIARAEAGSHRDNMARINVSELVQDTAELYLPVAEDEGFDCEIDIAPDLELFGHRDMLAQAMVNLLDNAIKHGRSTSQPKPRLTISAARDGGMLRLTVADNGPGIVEADRQRVLDRFVRLEASRNTPGSGLGLSLAVAAAKLHGGTLVLEDGAPGLCAVMRLPSLNA
ncbi:MAG: HAMP domain-containing sensor histidine kinase [Parvibaculum sp.]